MTACGFFSGPFAPDSLNNGLVGLCFWNQTSENSPEYAFYSRASSLLISSSHRDITSGKCCWCTVHLKKTYLPLQCDLWRTLLWIFFCTREARLSRKPYLILFYATCHIKCINCYHTGSRCKYAVGFNHLLTLHININPMAEISFQFSLTHAGLTHQQLWKNVFNYVTESYC